MNYDSEFRDLKKKIFNSIYHRLNAMQKEAVCTVSGPLLVLAGAGSGKTTVLVNRISHIIKYGNACHSDTVPRGLSSDDMDLLRRAAVDYSVLNDGEQQRVDFLLAVNPAAPWNVLSITFTNKAAGEMKERLERLLGPSAEDIWASTFHSFCVRVLRRDIDMISGYAKGFTIYDSDDSIRVMKAVIKDLNVDDKQFPPRSVLNVISSAKDKLNAPEDFEKATVGDYRMTRIAAAYTLYQKRLKAANALDFDDLIFLTVKLLEENPDILSYYQKKFKYVLVDEYQDTSFAQNRLTILISGGYENICVVGDDDQSIYGFRGATIENILNFEKQFRDAKTIRLEQNYRSTQNILDAANSVIANNASRKGKTLFTKNGSGNKIMLHTAFDERDEARYIIDTILKYSRENGLQYSDFAVLYRINAQSNALENALSKSGIPYRIIGGVRFYDRMEIKDITAYLNVVANPSDNLRLKRIINTPSRGIGDRTVEIIEGIANGLGLSMMDVITDASSYPELSRSALKLCEFCAMIDKLRQTAENGTLTELVEELYQKSGYINFLKMSNDIKSEERLENILELKSNIALYEKENPDAGLSGFLEEVALVSDLDNYNADADAITLMTIHSSKGLEFPVVIICGMEDGIFPSYQSQFEQGGLEEERRLCYVALTRAKKQLMITNAKSRMLFGSTSFNRPSQFLKEIPQELFEISVFEERQHTAYASNAKTKRHYSGGKSMVLDRTTPRTDDASYSAGDRVIHDSFGAGLVVSARPMGADTLLEIVFDTAGSKKIMASYAKDKLKKE